MLSQVQITPLEKKQDQRGWLIEAFRGDRLDLAPRGQVYVTSIKPGFTRANHYHARKTEHFCVIDGDCLLILVDTETGEKKEAALKGSDPAVVKIPPLTAHSLINTGHGNAYILAFIDECFSPEDPDTYSFSFTGHINP